MRNIHPGLMLKMLSGSKNRYIFFQISAVCILDVCAYIHATFLLVEIADRFLGQALYG